MGGNQHFVLSNVIKAQGKEGFKHSLFKHSEFVIVKIKYLYMFTILTV